MTFISTRWISSQDQTIPPWWAICTAVASFSIGALFLWRVISDIYKPFKNYRGLPGAGEEFLDDFHNHVPDAKNSFDIFKKSILEGKINTNSSEFNSFIDEIGTEFNNSYCRIYFGSKRNEFIKMILTGIICVILIFSFLYIADYTIDEVLYKEDGFKNNKIKEGNFPECLIDGLYYSVVTVATLGYGDIHPGKSIVARIISMSEVLIFVFFFGIGIAFVLSFMPISSIVNAENLKNASRDKLEKVAEAVNS
jgi:hypothetical protein